MIYLLVSLCLLCLSSPTRATRVNLSSRQYGYPMNMMNNLYHGQMAYSPPRQYYDHGYVQPAIQYQDVPCDKATYSKDKTCFVLNTPSGLLLRPCGDGTAFHRSHCSCDSLSLAGHFADHDCRLAHTGQSVYVHANHASTDLSSCSYIPAYNALLNFKTDCGAAARAWSDLKQLYEASSVCYRHLTSEMSNYFSHNRNNDCSCYDRSHSYIPHSNTGSYAHCTYHDTSFHNIVRKALSRNTACGHDAGWSDLNKVSDDCMDTLFSVLEGVEPHLDCRCSQGTDQLATGSQQTDCSTNQGYNYLESLLNSDRCDSDRFVIEKLRSLESSPECSARIIGKLNQYYGKMSTTPSNCTCSSTMPRYISENHQQCNRYSSYNSLHDHFFGDRNHRTECRTHHTLWHDLNSLMMTQNFGQYCEKTLVDAVHTKDSTSNGFCHCQSRHNQGTGTSGGTGSGTNGVTDYVDCSTQSEYQSIKNYVRNYPCVTSNQVWAHLQSLTQKTPQCLSKLVLEMKQIATQQRATNTMPNCHCSASYSKGPINIMQTTYFNPCNTAARGYSTILQLMFRTSQQAPLCIDHNIIWDLLADVPSTGTLYYCQSDIVDLVSSTMEHNSNSCACSLAAAATTTTTTTTPKSTPTTTPKPTPTTTLKPTTTPVPKPITSTPMRKPTTAPAVVVTSAPTTTTTASSTSSPALIGLHSCDKLATITAIAHNNVYLNDSRVPCAGTSHSKPEASVTSLCSAPSSLSWTSGYKVKDNCNSIPPYTAIATFIGNTYPDDGQAGVFVGCNSTSISMIVQSCDRPLEVVHINAGSHGSFTNLIDSYFTIHW